MVGPIVIPHLYHGRNQMVFTRTPENPYGRQTIDDPAPSGYSLPQGAAAGPNTFSVLSIQNTFFDTYRNPYSIEGNRTIRRPFSEQAVVELAPLFNRALLLAGITTVSSLVKMTQPAKDLRSRIADRNNSI
jgi:hypothetical protein